MRLTKARVRSFQSILDSTEFEIGDITCLVGKNEAGKTALLKALYRLNPLIEKDGKYDVTDDYPRRSVSDYQDDVAANRREPAEVADATYALEQSDIDAAKDVFGPGCFNSDAPSVTLTRGYDNHTTFTLQVDEDAAVKHLIVNGGLVPSVANELLAKASVSEMAGALVSAEQTDASRAMLPILQGIAENDVSWWAYNRILRKRIPRFLYFDEYYQLRGEDNVDALQQRVAAGQLQPSDHPLLGLLELARLDLQKIKAPRRTEALLAQLEAAENQLTIEVLKYWSQNRHLRLRFDIRPAQPEDPPGMTAGTNIWGRVHDTKHMVSTSLGTRSRGFVWFFSFLAWFSQIRRKGEKLILLLDEPGLSLHAKAQADLLNYFEEELKPHNQLIYTTHSPFMVDPKHLGRVRIVQDLSIEEGPDEVPEEMRGTRIVTDVLQATPDSLFPLQGALGYEMYQTLFVGPHSLVVEGVSDLLYLQAISALLQSFGEPGLRSEWTITPVGGADKVPTFVAMIGAQAHLNVAVLVDFQKKDQQAIENLYKKRLLERRKVLTYADFVKRAEADVEDMFDPEFFLKLVNEEYRTSISVGDLGAGAPRVLSRLAVFLAKNPMPNGVAFNHYRPARYLAENLSTLSKGITGPQLDRFRDAFNALNALL